MGFWKNTGHTILKGIVVDRAFSAGQNGEPPPVYSNSEEGKYFQEISDEAYEQGQKSVLVKIGNKVEKKITD